MVRDIPSKVALKQRFERRLGVREVFLAEGTANTKCKGPEVEAFLLRIRGLGGWRVVGMGWGYRGSGEGAGGCGWPCRGAAVRTGTFLLSVMVPLTSMDFTVENSPGTRSGPGEMTRGLKELFEKEALVAWTRAMVMCRAKAVEWSGSEYVLKVKPTRFPFLLSVSVQERGVEGEFKILA